MVHKFLGKRIMNDLYLMGEVNRYNDRYGQRTASLW